MRLRMWAPMRAALAISSSSSSSMVASAAEIQTGFPPKVDACAPGFQLMISARATVADRGMPLAIPLASVTISGDGIEVLGREHLSGPAHPALDLIEDQQDVMPLCERLQFLKKALGRNDIPALALDGLDENGGDFVGGNNVPNQDIFDVPHTFEAAGVGSTAELAAIAIRVRRMMDARHQRAEALLLNVLAAGQRQRSHGSAMEGAEERDELLPSGVVAGHFDGGLDGLRPELPK